MLKQFLHNRVAAGERQLGVPLDYMHHLVDVAPGEAWRLARFTSLMQGAGAAPRLACHVASICAARMDDCGPCVQIGVNLALADGVDRQILVALVAGATEQLPEDLQEVCRFTEAVIDNAPEQHDLREQIRRRYGEAGLVHLSRAIAMHRVFPTYKRALGYANSCTAVAVEV